MKKLLLPLAFVVILASCEDREATEWKTRINKQLSYLQGKEVDLGLDLSGTIQEYKDLRKDIVDYTDWCNNNGYHKNNDKTIAEIDDKIKEYEEKQLQRKTTEDLNQERRDINHELEQLRSNNSATNFSIENGDLEQLNHYLNKLVTLKTRVEEFNDKANHAGITYNGVHGIVSALELQIVGTKLIVDGAIRYRQAVDKSNARAEYDKLRNEFDEREMEFKRALVELNTLM